MQEYQDQYDNEMQQKFTFKQEVVIEKKHEEDHCAPEEHLKNEFDDL